MKVSVLFLFLTSAGSVLGLDLAALLGSGGSSSGSNNIFGNIGDSLDLATLLGSNSNDQVTQIAMQMAQEQIDNFINNGGAAAALADLVENGKLQLGDVTNSLQMDQNMDRMSFVGINEIEDWYNHNKNGRKLDESTNNEGLDELLYLLETLFTLERIMIERYISDGTDEGTRKLRGSAKTDVSFLTSFCTKCNGGISWDSICSVGCGGNPDSNGFQPESSHVPQAPAFPLEPPVFEVCLFRLDHSTYEEKLVCQAIEELNPSFDYISKALDEGMTDEEMNQTLNLISVFGINKIEKWKNQNNGRRKLDDSSNNEGLDELLDVLETLFSLEHIMIEKYKE